MHINSIKIVYHILNAEEKYLAKNTTRNKTASLLNNHDTSLRLRGLSKVKQLKINITN